MRGAAGIIDDAALSRAPLDQAIGRGAAALAADQRPDGHWCYELEADATIPAEYILLRHFLGEPTDATIERRIAAYLRRRQSADHSGWPLFHGGGLDVSASVKAYFALKMIGDDPAAPHMARARAAILAAGGAERANVFTRIQLALFGAGGWDVVPSIPPELILAPRWLPVHLSKMAYWARTVIVPLLVLAAIKPRAKNPLGVLVDELYAGRPAALTSRAAHVNRVWKAAFAGLDWALKRAEPRWPPTMRARAIAACEAWVTARLNGEDGLGAIYPAMANSVMMYAALGVPADDPHRAAARASVEKLLVHKGDETYCQPCVSPVWDTALAAHAMLEVGDPEAVARANQALDWLRPRQELDMAGDWAEQRPGVRPGGWAFQYANPAYPDLDDTAVAVMAFDRAAGSRGDGAADAEAIARGTEWCLGLQSNDGGFAAFDADNTAHYLNNVPFADHGALLDPPTADVTARVVSMLAQLGETPESQRMAQALRWLERTQEADGAWFGRWGVNYVYGTWSVLCALGRAGLAGDHPMVAKAVAWLEHVQNEDGGWGEGCESYDLTRRGHQTYPSTASQTAWACLGLMAVGRAKSGAVARGIGWLLARQEADGMWGQEAYTGGGFPRVFYLRYHGYPRFFPVWALARYRNLLGANAERPAWGM